MRVKFLVDYEGRETAYKKVKAGDEMELDHQPAIELIKFGIVEEVIFAALSEFDSMEKRESKPIRKKSRGDE